MHQLKLNKRITLPKRTQNYSIFQTEFLLLGLADQTDDLLCPLGPHKSLKVHVAVKQFLYCVP